jgi:hypothetical protein
MTSENPERPTVLVLSTSTETNGRDLTGYIAQNTSLDHDQIGFRGPDQLQELTAARLITKGLRLVIVHSIRPPERDMALALSTDMSKKLFGSKKKRSDGPNKVALYGSLWGNLSRGERAHLAKMANTGFVDSVRPYYGDSGRKHLHLMDWLLQRGVDLSENNGQEGSLTSINAANHLLVTDHRERWESELTRLWSDQAGLLRSRILVRDLAGEGSIDPDELVNLCREGLGNVLIHLTNPDHFDRALDLVETSDDKKEGTGASAESDELDDEASDTVLRVFLFSETLARLFPDSGERAIAQDFVSQTGVSHAQRSPSWTLDGEVPKALKSWMGNKS